MSYKHNGEHVTVISVGNVRQSNLNTTVDWRSIKFDGRFDFLK